MSLVKVLTCIGADSSKPSILPAKIVATRGTMYTIRYMSPTDVRDPQNRMIFKYEEETYDITEDSISEYLDTTDEMDIGYLPISSEEYVRVPVSESDSDDDYHESDENSSEDSDKDSEPDDNDEGEYDDGYDDDD